MITQQAGVLKQATLVTLKGRGDITLHPSHYMATGGEGSIYKPSTGTVVKLYSDPYKMKDMEGKITLLSHINHPFIVSPKGVVYKGKNAIGYYMNFATGDPLARVFTTSYRQRENFKDKDAITLVEGMRTTVIEAHNHKAIVVDANEFNWLVYRTKQVVEPRIIDVDSWAIQHWKASVIMPSIRDWHTHSFTEESDWFSFGVVSFQVFTGIHPYKGILAGYKPNDIETRMKDNKSVFTPGVRLNSAVRDFGVIPKPLLEWYEAVFQQGERAMPPSVHQTIVSKAAAKTLTLTTSRTGGLEFTVLYDGIHNTPLQIFPCGIVRLASGKLLHISNGVVWNTAIANTVEVIEVDRGYLVTELMDNKTITCSLLERSGTIRELSSSLIGVGLFRFQERLFVITETGLVEITVKDLGKMFVVTKNTWQFLRNATTWFKGVGIQQSLGAVHLILPFDENACTYVSVPDLVGKKVVDAIAGTRYVVISVLDTKKGTYFSYQYTFDREYKNHQVTIKEVDTPELNIALLPKGVCASIVEDGKLEIAVPTAAQVREVLDPQVKMSFVLSNWQNKVVFIQDKKIWSVATK